jgi:poly-beta-hydroxyalkanoate depolymerase
MVSVIASSVPEISQIPLGAAMIYQTFAAFFRSMRCRGASSNGGAGRSIPARSDTLRCLRSRANRGGICAAGQTLAAQELCSSLRPYLKTHHVQSGVCHHGVFNGQRWKNHVYPIRSSVDKSH